MTDIRELQTAYIRAIKRHQPRSHIQRKMVAMKCQQIKSELPMTRNERLGIYLGVGFAIAFIGWAFMGIGQ